MLALQTTQELFLLHSSSFSFFHQIVKFLCSFFPNFNVMYFLHPMSHVDRVFFCFLFCPTPSLLPTPYSHCFCWLSLSLCDYFVAKLEPAVHVSSCVQAPSLAAQHSQSFPQVPQPSSLPLGLLAGICNRVACQSVRHWNP